MITFPSDVPEPLADTLYRYCDVNAPELTDSLRRQIATNKVTGERANAIRQSLRLAIQGTGLTPSQYKLLTGDNECATPELLRGRLVEIYGEIFPNEEIL